MGKYCVAVSCANNQEKIECKGKSFFRFPLNNALLLKAWLVKIRRADWNPNVSSRLCSDHFTNDCFKIQPYSGVRYLKKGSVPTLFSYIPTKPPRRKLKRIREDSPAASTSQQDIDNIDSTFKNGCQMHVSLRVDKTKTALEVKRYAREHNHEIIEDFEKYYASGIWRRKKTIKLKKIEDDSVGSSSNERSEEEDSVDISSIGKSKEDDTLVCIPSIQSQEHSISHQQSYTLMRKTPSESAYRKNMPLLHEDSTQTENKSKQTAQADEFESFGNVVASHLKKLPMHVALECQSDILSYLVQRRLGRPTSLSTIPTTSLIQSQQPVFLKYVLAAPSTANESNSSGPVKSV